MIDNLGLPARSPAAGGTTSGRSGLPSLTGLRFFAALIVFGVHITLLISPIPPYNPINPFADKSVADSLEFLFRKAGYPPLSCFFVLSGFVLTWSYKPNRPATAFWRRRLMKIFPNQVVMWAIAMVTFAASITPALGWGTNLFLVNAWIPQGDVMFAVNPQSWSLCSEVFFYLLFPVIIVGLRKIAPARLWWWAGGMVACMVGVQLITVYLVPSTPQLPVGVSIYQIWTGYVFPISRLFEFVLGALLALIISAGRWVPVKIWQALVLLAIGYVAALFLPVFWTFNVATIVGVGALIGSLATADINGSSTFLATRPMLWLGEVSFAFYAAQGVVVFYGRPLTGGHTYSTPVALLVVAAFFGANLLAGWLLMTLVERPMMKRWAQRRPKQAPPVLPSAAEVRS
ncbi:MAG: hypothetical protein QOE23_522 [Pseudonocardiales bacterium]|jgi:peptidoglycan/LPS O-acetylase OafA/YrhL|nr:hypothetical protein [Pseudonocardiales bacterium]